MTNKFYITTPIYYVNDVPHIGHAYTTIAADVLARYHRLRGDAVFFLTGTDEHGQKVAKAAQERGLTPKAHADSMTVNFRKLWKKLDITNDAFIRTTDKEHVAVVQELLQKLFDQGELEQRTYEGWYCTPDERFWTEKEIVEGKCPDCGRPVERISESNYFFLMSKYQERLIAHIEQNPNYIRPDSRRNEVLGFLKSQTLGDLCISRPKARLAWGIELPFDNRFCHLRLVRRPGELFFGHTVSEPPGTGLDGPGCKGKILVACGPPPGRQGHPYNAQCVLVHDADGTRTAASGEHLCPRLVDTGRQKDVEVARECDRPARGRRCLRRRCVSLFRAAGSALRPGRRLFERDLCHALQYRAGERPGEPALAGTDDDREVL